MDQAKKLQQTGNKPSYSSLKPFVFIACYEQENQRQLYHIIPEDINGVRIHTHIKKNTCMYIHFLSKAGIYFRLLKRFSSPFSY